MSPGAFGSLWTTEVTMRNESGYALVAFNGIPAHSTLLIRTDAPDGMLQMILRQAAPAVFFGTLIRDLSRQSEALGTEIPVVRESELFDNEILVDTFAFLSPSSASSQLNVAFIGDLLTTFPQLAGKGPLRIELDGTPGQRASWAFVSVTNNTTQNVTVISPQ